MTVLDSFVAFARGLPADRLQSLEDALGLLMTTHSPGHDFTSAELTELDRRVAEPRAQFAANDEIARLIGKSLPG